MTTPATRKDPDVRKPDVTDAAVDAFRRGCAPVGGTVHLSDDAIHAGLAAAHEHLPIRGCNGHDGCTCYQQGVKDGFDAATATP